MPRQSQSKRQWIVLILIYVLEMFHYYCLELSQILVLITENIFIVPLLEKTYSSRLETPALKTQNTTLYSPDFRGDTFRNRPISNMKKRNQLQ